MSPRRKLFPAPALRPLCLALALAGLHATAGALPQGAQVRSGTATVQTPAPNSMTVNQSSQQASIDWLSFSIGAQEKVTIRQPNADAVLLNRVIGADPSVIQGRLSANGRVFLSNPRGIVFGAGSQVDAGSLLATTLTLGDRPDAQGRWSLTTPAGSTPGAIRAEGRISAQDTIALVAPQVSVTGALQAARVGAAAAASVLVDVDGDGLILFNVRNDEGLEARLDQLGTLQADGGSAELRAQARSGFAGTVLNMEGAVRSRGLSRQGGEIVLDGGTSGITSISGSLDARAEQGRGGQVTVLGDKIGLVDRATVDASGPQGGGTVQVGGGWMGQGTATTASRLYTGRDTRISADATEQGTGGTVVLWSEQATHSAGQISARGGAAGGDGGAVETSSRGWLSVYGRVDASAPRGRAGQWLLDPASITISDAPESNLGSTSFFNEFFDIGADGNVNIGVLESALAEFTNVSVYTSGDGAGPGTITLLNDLDLGSGTLSLIAHGTIRLSGNVTSSPEIGSLGLYAGVNQTGNPNAYGAQAGDILLDADRSIDIGGSLTARTGGAITLSGPVRVGGSTTLTSRTGTISLPNTGNAMVGTVFADGPQISVVNGVSTSLATFNAGSVDIDTQGNPLTFSSGSEGTVQEATVRAGSVQLTGLNVQNDLRISATGPVTASGFLGVFGTLAVDAPGQVVSFTGPSVFFNTVEITSAADATLASDSGFTVGNSLVSGTFTLSSLDQITLQGSLSGTALLAKEGSGELVVLAPQLHSGGTELRAGTLRMDTGAGALGTGTVDVAAGTRVTLAVNSSFGGLSGAGDVDVAVSRLTVGGNGADTTFSGTISGNSGGLTKTGAGTLALSGTTNYAGATIVEQGTLGTTAADRLANASALDVRAAGTVSLGGDETVASIEGAGTILLNGWRLSAGEDNRSTTFSGTLQNGGLTKLGGGVLTLSGTNGLTDETRIAAGVLQLGDGGPTGDAGSGAIVNNGLLLVNRSGTLQIDAPITGTGAVQLVQGELTLTSPDNAWQGATIIDGGTLRTIGAERLPDGTVLQVLVARGEATLFALPLAAGGVSLGGDETVASIEGLGTIALNGHRLSFGADNRNIFFDGTLEGGSFAKLGTGTFTLTGVSTLTGQSLLAGGEMIISAGGGILGDSALQLGTGTRVTVEGEASFGALSGGGSFLLSGGTLVVGADNADMVYAGAVEGTGTLRKEGTGVATFTAPSLLTGSLEVVDGVLRLTASWSNALTANLVSPGTLQLTASQRLTDLTGDGLVSLDGGTLTLGTDNRDLAFGGGFTGTGTLVKEGTGTFVLSGNSTSFTGRSVVAGGTLQLGNGGLSGDLGSSEIVVDGLLRVQRSTGLLIASPITGSGSLELASGALTLGSTANAWAGNTVVNGGTLVTNGAERLPDGTELTVATAGRVLLGGDETVAAIGGSGRIDLAGFRITLGGDFRDSTFGGTLNGGSFTKTGTGSLLLGGANTLTGQSRVEGGSVRVLGIGSLGGDTSLDLATGTALNLDADATLGALTGTGTVAFSSESVATLTVGAGNAGMVFDGTVTGPGALRKIGTGTATFTAPGQMTGALDVRDGVLRLEAPWSNTLFAIVLSPGTLQLAVDQALGSLFGTGTVDLPGSTLTLGTGGVGILYDGGFSGTGTLAKVGAGTLTVAGSSPGFTGTTEIQAGTLQLGNGGSAGDLGSSAIVNSGLLRYARTDALTIASPITGSGNLEVTSGTLTLGSTANAWTGATTITGGTLATAGAERLPDVTVLDVRSGARVQLGGNETVAAITGTGLIALAGFDLTMGADGRDIGFAGTLDGGSFTKLGAGTLTLSGTNNLSGQSRLQGGTLLIPGSGGLTGGMALDLAAGTLLDLQADASLGALTGTGTALLGGVTLTLGAGNATMVFDGTIDGTGTLAKTGTGVATLTAPGTLQGTVDVQQGRLRLEAAWPDTLLANVGANGTLQLAADQALAGLSGPGTVDLDGSTLTLGLDDQSLTFGGSFSGSGGLLKAGTGTLTLTGASTFTGGTEIAEGTLTLSGLGDTGTGPIVNDGVLNVLRVLRIDAPISGSGNLVAGAGTLTLGSTANAWTGSTIVQTGATLATAGAERLPDVTVLDVRSGARVQLGGNETVAAITGAGLIALAGFDLTMGADGRDIGFAGTLDGGSFTKLGAGTLTLSGTNNLSGQSRLQGGTLLIPGSGGLTGGMALDLAAGTLLDLQADASLGALTGTGTALLGGVTLTLGAGNATMVFDGTIDGTGTLAKTGTGVATLTAPGTLQGTVDVQQGRLRLEAAWPDTLLANVGANGTLQLAADQALAGLSGPGTVDLDGSTLTLGLGNQSLGFGGSFSGSGGLLKAGTGTLTLTGASTFTGGTEIADGTLTLSGLGDTGTGPIVNDGVLNVLRVLRIDAPISGSGNLVAGAGTLTLGSTANAWTGSTIVQTGATLATAGAERLPDVTVLDVRSGARVQLGGNETVAAITGTGLIALGGFDLTMGADGRDIGFAGTLDGGSFTKLGAGTLTLSGTNNLSGQSRLQGGTLLIPGSGGLTGGMALDLAAGTLLDLQADASLGALTGTGTALLGGVTLTLGAGNATMVFDGTIDGTGTLAKTGTGVATLTAPGTLQGTVDVQQGRLRLEAAWPDTLLANVGANGTLQLAADQALAGLSGPGTVDLDGSTLTLGLDDQSLTFGGSFSGSGGLLKAGTGTLTLTGASTFTGGTEIADGTLQLGDGGSSGDAGAGPIVNDGVLRIARSNELRIDAPISGSGDLVVAAGTLTLGSAANAWTGATSITGGTLATAGAERLPDVTAVDVGPAGRLLLGGDETVAALTGSGLVQLAGYRLSMGADGRSFAFAGTLQGGSFSKLGSGTLTLSGTNGLTGQSRVQGGTLLITSAGALGGGMTLDLDAATLLDLQADTLLGALTGTGTALLGGVTLTLDAGAADGVFGGTVAGTGTLRKGGSGTLTLTGPGTLDGTLDVQQGRLRLEAPWQDTLRANVATGGLLQLAADQSLAGLSGPGTVDLDGSTLTLGVRDQSLAFGGSFSGSGDLLKVGAGTLTLTGSSSFSGGTRIAGGTLQLGDGGTSGDAGAGPIANEGVLRIARSNELRIDAPISGGGSLVVAGGTLTLGSTANTWTGNTRVDAGTLRTAGDERLSDDTAVTVAADATLDLGGAETTASIDAAGTVVARGDITTLGAQTYGGRLLIQDNRSITLSGTTITADNDGNDLGAGALGLDGGSAVVRSGRTGGARADLRLGDVSLTEGGALLGHRVTLAGALELTGGTLQITAEAAPDPSRTVAAEVPRPVPGTGRPLAWLEDTVTQEAGSRILLDQAATLQITASGGGSVLLMQDANVFAGSLAILSGPAYGTPWNPQVVDGLSPVSRVQVAGRDIVVGGVGLEADTLYVRADRLFTLGDAVLRARMPLDPQALASGVAPASLTLELTDTTFGLTDPYGNADFGINVEVGLGGGGGLVTVLPKNGAKGPTAVYLVGPEIGSGAPPYVFTFEGADSQRTVPVFYNGQLPKTPEVTGALSSVDAVAEEARRERFEETVRTENVTRRLRKGVIAEVGPGRPATEGAGGMAMPPVCIPADKELQCVEDAGR